MCIYRLPVKIFMILRMISHSDTHTRVCHSKRTHMWSNLQYVFQKKRHACDTQLSPNVITCTCVRAIWEFPGSERSLSAVLCYPSWVNGLSLSMSGGKTSRDLPTHDKPLLCRPFCKTTRPLLICTKHRLNFEQAQQLTSAFPGHVPSYFLREAEVKNCCLAGWMGPSHRSSIKSP